MESCNTKTGTKPHDLRNNRSNSGSTDGNLLTLLRKEGFNISADISPKTLLWKQETNHWVNLANNNIEGYLHQCPTLPTWHHMCKRAFCVPSWQTHLDLSDQHYTCSIFQKTLVSLHSIPHVRCPHTLYNSTFILYYWGLGGYKLSSIKSI